LRILRQPHDADEVVQEALTRAWRSRSSCRTPDAPLPWCLQITRNEAIRLIVRRRRVPSVESIESEAELRDENARSEPEGAIERLMITQVLRSLRPEERLLIALRYQGDYSHPEIAAALAIPEATARVRLHRALKRLQELLGADGDSD
jgi:RNA polymerase sigma-70 factor (ECF subfamily)